MRRTHSALIFLGVDRVLSTAQRVHVGPLRLPVPVVATGVSVATHGLLLAAACLLPWPTSTETRPEIQLAKGDQAIRVRIISSACPTPDDQEPSAREDLDHDEHDLVQPMIVEALPHPIVAETPSPQCETRREEPSSEPLLATSEKTTKPDFALGQTAPLERPPPRTTEKADESKLSDRDATPALPLVGVLAPREPHNSAGQRSVKQEPRQARQSVSPIRVTSLSAPSATETAANENVGVRTGVELLELPRPRYPVVSKRRGEEGLVLLRVEVLPSGRAGKIRVLEDPGFPRLLSAAIDAVRRATFRPAMRGIRPVRSTIRIPIRFTIE